VSLARAFRRTAEENGARLICADARPNLSAACQDNFDSVELTRADSQFYPEALRAICEVHEIGLIVPTIDTELSVLAGLRDSFSKAGTSIAVSSPNLVEIARDKRKTAEYFATLGVKSPTLFARNAPKYPVIAKPFDGSLSRDVHVLREAMDYNHQIRSIPNLMLAEYLDPDEHDEFTCDAYFDREEKLRCIVPRLRLEVRGGEVSKARTVRNNVVDLFLTNLEYLPGARGCLTFQFFRNRITSELYLIELNARFGGGFPLTLAAGADYPNWLYSEWVLDGSPPMHHNWASGLTMLRYDGEILIGSKEQTDG
jgi:carbamoyl-phosphate synthase large subunit